MQNKKYGSTWPNFSMITYLCVDYDHHGTSTYLHDVFNTIKFF